MHYQTDKVRTKIGNMHLPWHIYDECVSRKLSAMPDRTICKHKVPLMRYHSSKTSVLILENIFPPKT